MINKEQEKTDFIKLQEYILEHAYKTFIKNFKLYETIKRDKNYEKEMNELRKLYKEFLDKIIKASEEYYKQINEEDKKDETKWIYRNYNKKLW